MRTMLAAALALTMMAWAGTASAAQIGGSAAICRATPSTKAAVVERLAAHSQVDALQTRSGWTKVRTATPRTCWVSSRLVAGPSALPFASSSARRAASSATRSFRSTATRASRPRSPSSGGTCPCGSGSVCVGPRGGRYCITSGGNKRYGV
ncbi:SH3 domain-containing protein [Sphingomonas kyeonggiensis]|uniref:SH3b domain-containing protein n=1 Tax=Sphingomonas kyeonggiensis TaxID=1268553 RepID=A0A7W6JR69_9SPHN|nr:SH3 domain-containing protein [Sphingomonas kyeonggiensis]MBB4098008.1 hypothetical protein [Sphingomonas kyeonggiensis]